MAKPRKDIGVTETLNLFVVRVEELLALRLVTSGQLTAQLSIKGTATGQISFSQSTPDEEDLRSFLLTFRQLVSEKEPVFLRSVANVLWVAVDDPAKREILEVARAQYDHALRQGSLRFEHNGTHYSPEETLRQWINGRYFHNDQGLSAQLEQRDADPISAVMSRHAFMELLVEVTRYAQHLARCATYWRSLGVLLS